MAKRLKQVGLDWLRNLDGLFGAEHSDGGSHLLQISNAAWTDGQMLFQSNPFSLRQSLFQVIGDEVRQFLAG